MKKIYLKLAIDDDHKRSYKSNYLKKKTKEKEKKLTSLTLSVRSGSYLIISRIISDGNPASVREQSSRVDIARILKWEVSYIIEILFKKTKRVSIKRIFMLRASRIWIIIRAWVKVLQKLCCAFTTRYYVIIHKIETFAPVGESARETLKSFLP